MKKLSLITFSFETPRHMSKKMECGEEKRRKNKSLIIHEGQRKKNTYDPL